MKNFFKKKLILNLLVMIFFLFLLFFSLHIENKNNLPDIKNSKTNWTLYQLKNMPVFLTQSWFDYQTKKEQFIDFSIALPNELKLNDNIIYNSKNEKIGEFSPGVVDLQTNQTCFDKEWFNESGESELVSIKDINIALYKGKLLIEKSLAWNGTTNDEYWYPYFYCLENGNRAFVITFYEKLISQDSETLHRDILNTVKF